MKKFKRFFFLFFLVLSVPLLAKEKQNYGNVKVSSVIEVISGEIFRANLENFPPIIGKDIKIRISEILTPSLLSFDETVKGLAEKAREFLSERLKNAKEISLQNIKRDSSFRIVAELWVDGENLGKGMVERGLAKTYRGGKRPSWP